MTIPLVLSILRSKANLYNVLYNIPKTTFSTFPVFTIVCISAATLFCKLYLAGDIHIQLFIFVTVRCFLPSKIRPVGLVFF